MATKSSSAAATDAESYPTLEELWGLPCGNCTVGVLHVIRYDPDALHEVGQDLTADNQNESGGAYETQCFYCGQRLSHRMSEYVAESGEE